MAKVWTPWEGLIQRPCPARKLSASLAIKPRRRDQYVPAMHNCVAKYAWRVRLKAYPVGPDDDITTPGFDNAGFDTAEDDPGASACSPSGLWHQGTN